MRPPTKEFDIKNKLKRKTYTLSDAEGKNP